MTKRKRSPRSPHYISRVVTKGRVYHYSRPPKGRGSAGIRLPDDRDLAIKAMGQIIGRGYNHAPPYLQFLLVSSRQRAKEAGLEHTLTLADIESLYHRQLGLCAVSGLPFTMESTGDHPFLRAYAPSIDRIDNGLGYTLENVRLVCRIVNFAMGKWGLPALERVALAIAARLGWTENGDASK
jgi:hypothetical protein